MCTEIVITKINKVDTIQFKQSDTVFQIFIFTQIFILVHREGSKLFRTRDLDNIDLVLKLINAIRGGLRTGALCKLF